MNKDCLDHLLTSEEHLHFEEQGFLIVRNALSEGELVELEEAADRI